MATDLAELKQKGKAGTALAEMKPKEQVKYLLEQNKLAIAAAIPKHMNAERLMKVAQTAITSTPALLDCYVPTLLGGIIQCAQMGLEPNTVLGHAYLIPYQNKKKNRRDAQVVIGYKGLIDLARRSGQVVSIAAHAVRKDDLFVYEYGLHEELKHIPAEGDRGDITHFYAVAHMKDGGHAFEVMTRKQVEKIRDQGNKNPVWSEHFEEMGRKTAIRRLAKYLPLSVEFATGIAQDGQVAPTLETDGALTADFTVLDDDAGDEQGGGNVEGNDTGAGSAGGVASGGADAGGSGTGVAAKEKSEGSGTKTSPVANPKGIPPTNFMEMSAAQYVDKIHAAETDMRVDEICDIARSRNNFSEEDKIFVSAAAKDWKARNAKPAERGGRGRAVE